MTIGAEVKEDQNLDAGKTEKTKSVAVDPKAKDVGVQRVAQTGKLTPEERLAAIKNKD